MAASILKAQRDMMAWISLYYVQIVSIKIPVIASSRHIRLKKWPGKKSDLSGSLRPKRPVWGGRRGLRTHNLPPRLQLSMRQLMNWKARTLNRLLCYHIYQENKAGIL